MVPNDRNAHARTVQVCQTVNGRTGRHEERVIQLDDRRGIVDVHKPSGIKSQERDVTIFGLEAS